MKGRIWSRIGTVVCLNSFSFASNAGPSACACGISPVSAGRATSEKRLELASADCRALSVGRELDQRFLDRLLLVGEVAERRARGGDEAFQLGVVPAQFGGQQAEVVDHVRQGPAALGDGAVEVRDVVGERLQPAEGARKLPAAAADSLRARRQ